MISIHAHHLYITIITREDGTQSLLTIALPRKQLGCRRCEGWEEDTCAENALGSACRWAGPATACPSRECEISCLGWGRPKRCVFWGCSSLYRCAWINLYWRGHPFAAPFYARLTPIPSREEQTLLFAGWRAVCSFYDEGPSSGRSQPVLMPTSAVFVHCY